MTRVHVHLNWEAGDHAYLSIARPDQPVERIELTTADVARLLADGAYLWSVVEPRREGATCANRAHVAPPDHIGGVNKMVAPDRSAASVAADDTPHFIGTFGE
ncbi:hypothetical protein [Xanthobacter sediminis]